MEYFEEFLLQGRILLGTLVTAKQVDTPFMVRTPVDILALSYNLRNTALHFYLCSSKFIRNPTASHLFTRKINCAVLQSLYIPDVDPHVIDITYSLTALCHGLAVQSWNEVNLLEIGFIFSSNDTIDLSKNW